MSEWKFSSQANIYQVVVVKLNFFDIDFEAGRCQIEIQY